MHCTLSSNYFYASFVMILNDFRKKSIAMNINIGNAFQCYFASLAGVAAIAVSCCCCYSCLRVFFFVSLRANYRVFSRLIHSHSYISG